VALLVARSCGSSETEISQDQAVAIARQQIDFEPNDVRVRFQKRGFNSQPFWLVGLGIKRADGTYERAVNVLINAQTGEVAAVSPVSA